MFTGQFIKPSKPYLISNKLLGFALKRFVSYPENNTNMMILIDALYIHNGGGKILLDYLVTNLEKTDIPVFYLFDQRLAHKPYSIKSSNRAIYLSTALPLWSRYRFYRQHQHLFSKVFVLGNIPPLTRQTAETYTYFHNPMYISVPPDFSLVEKLKFRLKVAIIRHSSPNTDRWLVQSPTLQAQFTDTFGQAEKIEILPFFPELLPFSDIERQADTFLYVSNAQDNKNHIRLIQAFCRVYNRTQKGKLIVTVNQDYPKILVAITRAQAQGYPIENIGFVGREELTRRYQAAQYIIFPSLAESFGLGLVEGISLGCKIIGADLPYTHAICTPSLTFDPMDVDSIATAIETAMMKELPASHAKVENRLTELIDLLSENGPVKTV